MIKIQYMKLSYLLFAFLLLFTCCETEPKKETIPQKKTTEKTAPAPKPKVVEDFWKPFWATFKTAVQTDNLEVLKDHIVFPLKGSEAFNNGKQISKASFDKYASKIFDKEVKAIFKVRENMSEFATKKQKIADQLNVPVNTKIRTVLVPTIQNGKSGKQTESSVTFQFVEVAPGVFKLYSLVVAG